MSATSISALAADPILLEPSSSPSNASLLVAILSVGLVRTMLHPRVSESYNDHVFVCAAARCAPYFVAVAENCQNCAGSIAKEDMFDDAYPKARLRFVDVAYTVVRDGKEGPQCKRLPCDDSVVRLPSGVTRLQNSYATGCIAPHLVAFYEKCVAIACAWSASARDRQPLALRQRYCGTS